MKAVLLGTDYLEDKDGSVKIIETNTNTGIFNDGVSMMEFDSLTQALLTNNITEFHYIYTEDTSAVPAETGNLFKDKLQEICSSNNISFTEYEVPSNSITVPDVEDGEGKFILRQAFDASALIDSYAGDKFNFISLMSGSSHLPATYVSSSDDFLYDSLDSVDYTITDHPNLVQKYRYPQYDKNVYPKFSIIPDSTELQDKKSSISSDTDYILQEFIYNTNSVVDGYWSVIRSYDIIFGSELDTVHLGGYNHSAYIPLDFVPNQFISGTYDLTQKSRSKYVNKGAGEILIPYHTDLESTILMSDDTLLRVDTLETGSIIKTVTFDTLYNQSGSTILPWQDVRPLSEVSSSLQIVSSSLVSIQSQSAETLMVEISLENGQVWKDTTTTTYYIEESGSTDTRFESVNFLKVGDKIVTFNKNTNELSTKEITNLDVVFNDTLDIYNLDFEPTDYFLVDVGNDEFSIMHNVCTGCAWATCGDYWCDNACIGCGSGKEQY